MIGHLRFLLGAGWCETTITQVEVGHDLLEAAVLVNIDCRIEHTVRVLGVFKPVLPDAFKEFVSGEPDRGQRAYRGIAPEHVHRIVLIAVIVAFESCRLFARVGEGGLVDVDAFDQILESLFHGGVAGIGIGFVMRRADPAA